MHVTFFGKRWQVVWEHLRNDFGLCQSPSTKGKRIYLAKSLKGNDKLLMEVVIHESLHASNWHLDEEFVEQYAKEVTAFLYRLGFRCDYGTEDEDGTETEVKSAIKGKRHGNA